MIEATELEQVQWAFGNIRIEPAQKKRTCHKCRAKIKKGSFSLRLHHKMYNINLNLCEECLTMSAVFTRECNQERGKKYDRIRESV